METELVIEKITKRLIADLPSDFPERVAAIRGLMEEFNEHYQELASSNEERVTPRGSEA